MNGVINIYKNTGMTSFDVVAMVRRVAKMKKVGHTGTLDPAASGVLPVCLGKATKIIIPSEIQSLAGLAAALKEVADKGEEK